MARRLYAYAFFEEFILLYPVYTLLFVAHGLTPGQISSLFAIWSLTGFVLEVPSGLWADVFSRKRLLILSPIVTAAGYGLWTTVPSYPAFALGFVAWGTGGALASGTLQALVYEELARHDRADQYARLIGRSRTIGTAAVMAATGLASPVLAVAGYPALSIASVVAPLLQAAVACTFPEPPRGPREQEEHSFRAVLRTGLTEVRQAPSARRALLIMAVVYGLCAIDEYTPLVAQGTGVATTTVPLLELLISAGIAAGGWFAGRGTTRIAPALAVAALLLAGGAATVHPAGFVPIALAFAVFHWADAAAESWLQDAVSDRARATVISLSGLATEAVTLLVYAGYALASLWVEPWLIFVFAAVPYLLMAAALRRRGRSFP